MKNNKIVGLMRIIALTLSLVFMVTGCTVLKKNSSEAQITETEIISEVYNEDSESSVSKGDTSKKNESSNKGTTTSFGKGQNNTSDSATVGQEVNGGSSSRSEKPEVTVAEQVATDICVVAGICSKNTEYIKVSGNGVIPTKITPFAGKDKYYFMGQVEYQKDTDLTVIAKEKNKSESSSVIRKITHDSMSENKMTKTEYRPVIGTKGQMHFYSAILSYTLSSNRLTNTMKSEAQTNISNVVSLANRYGAEPIFFIIPSSTEIYPETIPSQYKKRSGESLVQAFTKIANNAGAKVIYPVDTMKKHKNDGVGYQIYQHTDSHWSAYGAYWGTYDLFQYIAKKFPSAKPRTLSEMGFYTVEMCAGDAIFNLGFERTVEGGLTSNTQIRELTNLYSLQTPVNTVKQTYNSLNGLYLTEYNKPSAVVNNPNGGGLPTALIMRDSFGKVAYDMVSDRFKTVYWGEFDNYRVPQKLLDDNGVNKLDYVIYFYSERNILKLMLNNSNAILLTLE